MHRGIFNVGNTCYFNTAMQCLLHTNSLSSFLKDGLNRVNLVDTPLFHSLCIFYKSLVESSSEAIDPRFLLQNIVSKFNDRMELREQNDIQEFIVMFIDELNKEISGHVPEESFSELRAIRHDKKSSNIQKFKAFADIQWLSSHKREYSVLVPMLYGQQVNQLMCNKCKSFNHIFENFVSIEISFPDSYNPSEPKCIKEMIETTLLDEDVSSRECDECNQNASAIKSHKFWRLPRILMVFIKRFNSSMRKINYPIQVDHTMQIECLTSRKQDNNYQLTAIGCHQGGMHSGHYYALCKGNDSWYLYDDDHAEKIQSIEKYPPQAYYVLIYENV